MLHWAFTRTPALHVLLATVNSPLAVMDENDNLEVKALVSVMVIGELVVPTDSLGNVSVAGDTVTAAIAFADRATDTLLPELSVMTSEAALAPTAVGR